MTLFHGTGSYALAGFLKELPQMWPRAYVRGRKAFSTTTDFGVASMFAIRRSSIEEMRSNTAGVVLEFELAQSAVRRRDFIETVDVKSMQDEKEIAIFNVRKLRLFAVWEMVDGKWNRRVLELQQ
jgi:hypothetical protein